MGLASLLLSISFAGQRIETYRATVDGNYIWRLLRSLRLGKKINENES